MFGFYLSVSSFFSLSGLFVDAVFFLSSLSLRRWGNPNPPKGVWGSPCVSSSCSRTPPSTRTSLSTPTPRPSPAPAFVFFFCFSFVAVARFPVRVVSRFCPGGVGFPGGFLGSCLGRLSMLDYARLGRERGWPIRRRPRLLSQSLFFGG